MGPAPFVGRQAERDHLSATYSDASARIAIITGEAGAGKTRLVTEFLRDIPARNVIVVNCFQLAGEPFSFLNLHAALGSSEKDMAVAASPFIDGQRVQFTGWAATVQERSDPAWRGILVVEDIHWADRTTLDFLVYLARCPGDFFIILTCRTGDGLPDAVAVDTMADLARLASVRQFSVPRLTIHESELLIDSVAKAEVARLRRRELAERSDGNPYLLIELAEAEGVLPSHIAEVLLAANAIARPAPTDFARADRRRRRRYR